LHGLLGTPVNYLHSYIKKKGADQKGNRLLGGMYFPQEEPWPKIRGKWWRTVNKSHLSSLALGERGYTATITFISLFLPLSGSSQS
jgi:hypothetical protein